MMNELDDIWLAAFIIFCVVSSVWAIVYMFTDPEQKK